MNAHENLLAIDLPAYIVASLCGLCCGIVGALLLLKRQTMMADALSHSVLPGLALAYILSGTMAPAYLFAGALGSCLAAGGLIILIQRLSPLSGNVAMGITLTSMFAAGVLLLEIFVGGRVHLDAEHALYGALELVYWPDPGNPDTMPQPIKTLLWLSAFLISTVFLLQQRLKLCLFDPRHAALNGISAHLIHALILFLAVLVCVASFDAVGSILVLALFACPPACARMITDRFSTQILLSGLIGIFCGAGGYFAGAVLPALLGFATSLNAAGSIAVLSGICLVVLILWAPEYGHMGGRKPKQKNTQKIRQ